MTDLSDLPLPGPVRTELRRALARCPGWPRYRYDHGIHIARVTRAQWLAAAEHFQIDVRAMVEAHCFGKGHRFVRRRDKEITAKMREWL